MRSASSRHHRRYATVTSPRGGPYVEQGDLVDFGAYGRLYVVRDAGSEDNYWVTPERIDRYNPDARGNSINKSFAERVVEHEDESDDGDED